MQPFPIYGGHKIAFRALWEGNDLHARTIGQVSEVIEAYRLKKQRMKHDIERAKEDAISDADVAAEKELCAAVADLHGLTTVTMAQLPDLVAQLGIPQQRRLDVITQQISTRKIGQHKATLYRYHESVIVRAGWRWPELRADLEQIPGIAIDTATLAEDEGLAYVKVGEVAIYAVYFGPTRFDKVDPSRGFGGNVYVKNGYTGYYYQTSKEFVRDSNKVWTRRYVARAVTIFHLASMFGLAIRPPESVDHPLDLDLPPRLRRRITPGGVEPAVTVATFSGNPSDHRRLDEQRPRYREREFGAHADVFDLGAAAIVDTPVVNPDFTPYLTHSQALGPRVGKTRIRVVVGACTGRGRTTAMGHSERASMQVRNGSGPVQPYLSTASIQWSGKVIRANKGERFDTGAENQATLEIDLSLAARDGIDIVNQHADESHQFKIAYDRYYDKDDITALERRVYRRLLELRGDPTGRLLLAELIGDMPVERIRDSPIEPIGARLAPVGRDVVRRIGLDPKLFDGLSDAAVAHIVAFEGPLVDVAREKTKRPAADELDEYIYSARKNREVLMDRIPISCVVRIKLNNERGKWLAVNDQSFPALNRALETGNWYGFSEIQEELRRYLTGDADHRTNPYGRIRAVYMHAAEDKLEESGRT